MLKNYNLYCCAIGKTGERGKSMRYKIKLYIGGHLTMVTCRTDTLKNVLSCARKSITLFSECDERVKICILDSDGSGIMTYVTGNKPKPVYTAIDHVNKERKTYYTGE